MRMAAEGLEVVDPSVQSSYSDYITSTSQRDRTSEARSGSDGLIWDDRLAPPGGCDGLIRDDRTAHSAEKMPQHGPGYYDVPPQSEVRTSQQLGDGGLGPGGERGEWDAEQQQQQPTWRSRRRLVWILVGIIALLVILGAVLGGVLGSSRAGASQGQGAGSGSGGPPSSTTTSTQSTDTPTNAPVPDGIRPNSGLTVTAVRRPEGVQKWVYYQDNDGLLHVISGVDSWTNEKPVLLPINAELNASVGTALAATMLIATETWTPQRELFLIKKNGRVGGMAHGSIGSMGEDSIATRQYQAHQASRVGAYWPFVYYVDINGDLAEVRSLAGASWNLQRLGARPAPGTRIAVVPLSTNFSVSALLGGGGYGVFVQQHDGALAALWPFSDKTVIPPANQSWPYNKADAPPFPGPKLPIGASFAAFAAAATASPELNRVDTYLLYQDAGDDDNNRIKVMFLGGGETQWRTDLKPSALARADSGTDIACLTMPQTDANSLDNNRPLALEPASPETARCYFQRGGRLVEVTFDGLEVSGPVELPVP